MRTQAVTNRSGGRAVRRGRSCRNPFSGDVVDDAVERPRHGAELERPDEETRIAQLSAPRTAHETAELPLDRPRPPGGLPLKCPEGLEVAFRPQHRLDTIRTQRANQLVLEVCAADEEAEALHRRAGEVRAKAGALEAPQEDVLLAGVAETGQSRVRAVRPEECEEPRDRLGAADWDDGDSFELQVAPAALGKCLDGDLIAEALHEHDRRGLAGACERACRRLWAAGRKCGDARPVIGSSEAGHADIFAGAATATRRVSRPMSRARRPRVSRSTSTGGPPGPRLCTAARRTRSRSAPSGSAHRSTARGRSGPEHRRRARAPNASPLPVEAAAARAERRPRSLLPHRRSTASGDSRRSAPARRTRKPRRATARLRGPPDTPGLERPWPTESSGSASRGNRTGLALGCPPGRRFFYRLEEATSQEGGPERRSGSGSDDQ